MSNATDNQKIINFACQTNFSTIRIKLRISGNKLFSSLLGFLAITSMVFLASCKGGTQAMNDETPTRGNIRIISDDSFQPLIETEVYTFTSLYQNAKVKPIYKPEFDVINDFMNDSVKVIVTSKKLTEDQIKYLRDTLIIARTTPFAYDALALITNKENKDTLLKYYIIRDIFKGKITRWDEIDPKSKLGEIRIIFDNTKSGNIRYFKELFGIEGNLPSNFFAVNSHLEVVNFVTRNPDALGIISTNWVSDKDDPKGMSFIRKVNTLAISSALGDDGYYYRPQPGSIYDKSYPFVRQIYLISRETFSGLGTGFIQWATGEQGQRIVLKSGLVPATMPIRLVQIKNE